MEIEAKLRKIGNTHARLARQLAPIEECRARLIREAAAQGLSRRRIASAVGLSFQRVDQIVRSGRG